MGFVEDKLFLEAQRFQAGARDREIREKDCFFEGKNRENGSDEGGEELGISLFSEKKEREKECLYPKVQFTSPLIECDSEYSNGVNRWTNVPLQFQIITAFPRKGRVVVMRAAT